MSHRRVWPRFGLLGGYQRSLPRTGPRRVRVLRLRHVFQRFGLSQQPAVQLPRVSVGLHGEYVSHREQLPRRLRLRSKRLLFAQPSRRSLPMLVQPRSVRRRLLRARTGWHLDASSLLLRGLRSWLLLPHTPGHLLERQRLRQRGHMQLRWAEQYVDLLLLFSSALRAAVEERHHSRRRQPRRCRCSRRNLTSLVFSLRLFSGKLPRVVDRVPIAPVSRAIGGTMLKGVCSVLGGDLSRDRKSAQRRERRLKTRGRTKHLWVVESHRPPWRPLDADPNTYDHGREVLRKFPACIQ